MNALKRYWGAYKGTVWPFPSWVIRERSVQVGME
jgi:hypothetical protein